MRSARSSARSNRGNGRGGAPGDGRPPHAAALGLTGLRSYTLAVADIEGAAAFLRSFLSATDLYDAPRPGIAAYGKGLRVADATIELLTPAGGGALADHLHRFGDGIRSTVFVTRDIAAARRHLAACGLTITKGTTEDGFAVQAGSNLGLMFEFVAAEPTRQ